MNSLIKLHLILVLQLIILTSCQRPNDKRIRYNENLDQQEQTGPNNFGFTPENYDFDNPDLDPGDGDDGTEANDPFDFYATLPQEIRSCQWSADGQSGFSRTHSSIGDYSICQGTNELDIFIQVKNPPSVNNPICLLPTTTEDGDTFYIGEPKCVSMSDNQTIYKITLDKNRSGASQYPVDGVAIMKYELNYYNFPPISNGQYYQQKAGMYYNPYAYVECIYQLQYNGDDRFCRVFDSVGQYVQNNF